MIILFSKLLIPKNYSGLAIFPFVFLKHKDLKKNDILINHERIHLRQQIELLIIPFFIWYFIEFLIHLIRFRNWNKAYHSISFEKEAYHHETNPNYLLDRKFWAFLKYYK